MLLPDKVAIITGAASGIGRACADRFVAEGARVVIADIDEARGEAAARALAERGEAIFVRTDIADADSGLACVARTVERFGRLDVLVNNAARLVVPARNDTSPLANARAFFEVNAFGTFSMIEAATPAMAKHRWGRIINVASEAAYLLSGVGEPTPAPGPDEPVPSAAGAGYMGQVNVYGWSKHAVIYLTKLAAVNLGPWGINVNCICPGGTGTEAYFAALSEEHLLQSALTLPTKRAGRPFHQAGVAAFLASEDAAMITGQIILADGGRKMPG
jgi:NAD(P)-dependent dehydrogenase (short-subunit alcohol dehydrogenase family)